MDIWAELQQILIKVTQIADLLDPFAHPKEVVISVLQDSMRLVDSMWYGFVLTTIDVDTGREFVTNATIRTYEPYVQIVANAGLGFLIVWGAFRIMWGHGLFTQYTARIMLPRLFMAAVLINFSQTLIQMVVDASNAASNAVQTFVSLNDPISMWIDWIRNPSSGAWEILTTAVLAIGYDALAIAYFLRYALLILLAITAPLAGLLLVLPETQHISKLWASHFATTLLMQPAQLFVLSIGFTLERDPKMPLNHLFALATLLIVFKIPGAMGASEKAAHKLQSTLVTGFHHIGHALAKA